MGKFDGVKETFVFYNDWMHTIDEAAMTDAEFRALMRIVVIYNETGIEPRPSALGAMGRMQFATMRRQIDKDREKWASTRESRSRAGKASGEARRRKHIDQSGMTDEGTDVQSTRNDDASSEQPEKKEQMFTMQKGVPDANKHSCNGVGDGFGIGSGHGNGDGYDCNTDGSNVPAINGNIADGRPGSLLPCSDYSSMQGNAPNILDEWFDNTLWTMYPRHEGREAARRALTELAPNETQRNEITAGLARALKYSRAFAERDIEHVPFLAKWLTDRRWEDEFEGQGTP